MTVLVVCGLAAGAALAWHLGGLAADVRRAHWPAMEPEHVEDDRSHDHRIAHLARLLGSPNLTEAHRTVVALAERLSTDGQVLDARMTAFLEHPPLAKPERYLRELAVLLARMEQT